MIYQFENYELDTDQYELRSDGNPVEVEPQVFRILELLVSNNSRVVTKDEIHEKVWQGRFISDSALSSRMTALRAAIGDDGKSQKLVKTIHGQGFRFIGELESNSLLTKTASGLPTPGFAQTTPKNLVDNSIAVLPFVDMSADGDHGYFADGMSEEILNALAKIPQLLVAGRTSSFHYKNQNIDIREIGAALNVSHILEGSVRKQGERVRITAQLIRSGDGFHQWSETYDGTLTDIFDLQDNVSCAIASELKILLKLETNGRLASKLTNDQNAYDFYLRARSNLYGDTTAENYASCFNLLNEALEIDPEFSAAWALLSRVYLNHSAYVWTGSAEESFFKARSTAQKAMEIDPHCAEALAVYSQCNLAAGDCLQSYEQAKEAFEKQPHVPALIYNWGHINCQLGYCREAAELMLRATEIDPLYSGYWNNCAVALQNIGAYDKVERPAKRAIELGDFAGYTTLAWNAFALGNADAAMEHLLDMSKELSQQLSTDQGEQALWPIVARAQFFESESDKAVIETYLQQQIKQPDFEPTGISINGAAQFGFFDSFFEQWPKTYFEKGNLGLLIWSDFQWAKNIRSHKGFQGFTKRAGMIAVWEKYGWPDSYLPN